MFARTLQMFYAQNYLLNINTLFYHVADLEQTQKTILLTQKDLKHEALCYSNFQTHHLIYTGQWNSQQMMILH